MATNVHADSGGHLLSYEVLREFDYLPEDCTYESGEIVTLRWPRSHIRGAIKAGLLRSVPREKACQQE